MPRSALSAVPAACVLLFGLSCGGNSTPPTAPPKVPTDVASPSYPNVAGSWDWTETYSLNSCDGETQRAVMLVVTQGEGQGTITEYSPDDASLASPLRSYGYQMFLSNEERAAAVATIRHPGSGLSGIQHFEMTPTALTGDFRRFFLARSPNEPTCVKVGTGHGSRR